MRQQQSIKPWWAILLISLFASSVTAHTVFVYPGWRGNNLHTTGNMSATNGLAIAPNKSGNNESELLYTLGMQWAYPCGGMPVSTNRTKWPIKGGAVSFQPGWFSGHKTAFIYINLGIGTIAPNMSHPLISPFQLVGPTKDEYPGTFCLPQVPIPKHLDFLKVGDNATIQIIETALHGAALYNCVDITFAEPEDVPEVTPENCFNSTQLSAKYIFAMDVEGSASSITSSPLTSFAIVPLLLAGFFGLLF
ncbi:hypothetical protein AJ79_01818 [Helicocarpus griseus UAMH5409]|uniref:Copper acquisition factor BIM1-like domain-containing protein n=1 Tax=Helicocarpus griseus UAMH5409 TaxID=1447875 RepID=A0A2B7Y581_9EURO|nr:hypothetical protein AJ79_01818 [Helicocarpus griseus UAMH5409]